MRRVLPVIVALVFPSGCFADANVVASPHATVAGEVENPGRFELTRAATLSAIFSDITKPLAMGATGRIRIYRNGTCRAYDVKRFGDVAVVDGDIVEVPIKYVYDEQAEDHIVPVFCGDSKSLLGQVVMLKSDLWKVHTNWREGVEGIEFRPTGEIGSHGGVSVFVRAATSVDLAKIEDQTGRQAPKNSNALLLICRDPGREVNPSDFESTLVARIRAIPGEGASDKNQPSQQTVLPNGP
jgi:hypothetical protein